MSDKNINMLQPDFQIDGLNLYKDDIADAQMYLAEQIGITEYGYSDGFVQAGSLDTFEDTTNTPFTESDEGKFIVVEGSSNGNDGVYQITTYVDASTVTLATSLAAAETGLTYRLHRYPNLEDVNNYEITQLANILGNYHGSKTWYNNLPKGFNAADTDGSNTKNETIDLTVLAANWYGSKTKITRNLVFTGNSVVATDTGVLLSTSRPYATIANRTGGTVGALPIFNSIANSGSYFDEGGINAVCKVNVIDELTGDEFFNSSGYVVFGKLHDGTDYHPSSLGDGTSVYVKFYQDDGTNGGLGSEYTWQSGDPATIRLELPTRKRRRDLLEHEEDSQFYGSTLGDAETAQDIAEIRDGLGLADGEGSGDWDWTNTTAYYPLQGDPATVEDAINALNDEIGDRQYTENNVVTDGETITESIDAIDQALSYTLKSIIIERITSPISGFTNHTIPFATGSDPSITTYKLDTANLGQYMEIYVNGKREIPHVDWSARGDYEEVNNTTVKFRYTLPVGSVIVYKIYDDA